MKRYSMNLANTFLLVLVVVMALSVEIAYAQAVQCGVNREVGARALDELSWKQLNAIYEDVSEEHFDDAYSDPRFNPDVDRQTGFRTRSIISLPIKDQAGEVFAVAQLLNRKDGQPFDSGDEQRFTHFIESIGVILETLEGLTVSEPEEL